MKRSIKLSGKQVVWKMLFGSQLIGLICNDNAAAMSLRRVPFHNAKPLQAIGEQPVWRTLAGYPGQASSNDGPGLGARFANPSGIAADGAGNIYVADTGNHTIRKISAAGVVTTMAGHSGIAGWKDGVGSNALFNSPGGLALGPDGSLYVSDTGNYVLRRISTAGMVSTLAGTVGQSGYRDGKGTNAWFGSGLGGVAVDTNGMVYVADAGNYVIRKIDHDGVASTFAGLAGTSGYQDGAGSNARFRSPVGLAFGGSGNLFVADMGNNLIRKITPLADVTTWAGHYYSSPTRAYEDGAGTNVWFAGPQGLAADNLGNLYVVESRNRCIRRISAEAEVSTLGGVPFLGSADHVDGIGPFARFGSPRALAIEASGHLVVADSADQTIRYGSLGPEPRPEILTQPIGRTVVVGSNLTLSVAAQSSAALTYQWLLDGYVIPGQNSNVFEARNLGQTDAGEYRVAVSDSISYTLSFPANVEVLAETTRPVTGLLDNWNQLASPPLQDTHGLAYGNGAYVAVGQGNAGSIASSTDGEHWVRQIPITSQMLNGIAFGGGKFVVVGAKGTVLTSADGKVWNPQTLTAEGLPGLNGITYANEMFVAISGDDHGSIWASSDGVNWTNCGVNYGVSFMAVAAAGGQFITLGNTIMISSNGVTWAAAGVPTNFLGQQIFLEHIGCGDGTLLASVHSGGRWLAASVNGDKWSDVTPANQLTLCQVAYGNGQFLAINEGTGGVCSSKDGVTWSVPVVVTNGGQTAVSPHLRFGGELFLASGTTGALFTSWDGQSWKLNQQEHALPLAFQSLVMIEDHYVAGSDSGLEISTNGSDWNVLLVNQPCAGLAYGNGTLVAAGGPDTIVSSQDGGTIWTDRSPHLSYGSATPWLSRVVFGTGTFVAFGSLSDTSGSQMGHVLASRDVLKWQRADLPNITAVNDAAYGVDLFVAVGNQQGGNGEILASTDGVSWKIAATCLNGTLNTIAFGNQRFVAGLGQGAVMMSADGVNWQNHVVAGAGSFQKIVFGNGLFLASTQRGVLSSADGLTWTPCTVPVANPQNIAATQGAFFIVGPDACLYLSGPFEWLGDPHWRSSAELQWTVKGAPHMNYRVEVSEDLRSWHTLTRFNNAPATHTFSDPFASQHPASFYRLVTE